jgi:hypothetical protein
MQEWERRFRPLLNVPKGRMAAFQKIAAETGVSNKRVIGKFYAYAESGVVSLFDRRKVACFRASALGLSTGDRALLARYVTRCGRRESGARALLRDWRVGRVKTRTPCHPATGFPRGWSLRNLLRNAPAPPGEKLERVVKLQAGRHPFTVRAGAVELQIAGVGTRGVHIKVSTRRGSPAKSP